MIRYNCKTFINLLTIVVIMVQANFSRISKMLCHSGKIKAKKINLIKVLNNQALVTNIKVFLNIILVLIVTNFPILYIKSF